MKSPAVLKVKNYAGRVIEALLLTGSRSATKYVNPHFVVRATRPMSKKRKKPVDRADSRSMTVLVTMGRPNYRDRQFIKDCKAAGEKFPVRNIRLRGFPAKR